MSDRDPSLLAFRHALAVLPVVVIAWLAYVMTSEHAVATDFTHTYLPVAHALLSGRNPYGLAPIDSTTAFVYPPIAGYIWIPLTAVPAGLAAGIAMSLTVLAIIATLALLDVRDWRCYAIALIWFPAVWGIQTANMTTLLVLGTAAAWRYRDRPIVAGLLTGLVIALKLYTWPLALFLLVTRRRKAAGVAVVSALAFVLVPWSWNGFAGLADYPHRMLAFEAAKRGNSLTLGALLAPGTGWALAHVIMLVAGGALVVLMLRRRGDDRTAFVIALAATLVLSPIVRPEYFLLLLIVLAVTQTPFGWPWLVPLGYWLTWQPDQLALWRIAATLAITAVVFASPFVGRRSPKLDRVGGVESRTASS